jgi:type I restriction enzyme S subunit
VDVRLGHKQTEVGVIPEEWDAIRIGDLFTFKNGLNKGKQFFGHGTPIVNYMDVFGCPGLRVAAICGRVDVSAKELSAYEVRKGDVFFTRTSETVEEVGIASVMLDEPEKTVYSGFVLRARPRDETLVDGFKAYCFSPRYFRQQVVARASYTTRALTSGRTLSAALLARPPKSEQRAIAGALSDVDALLGGLDRLIAKKRDLKQAAVQQLLTGQTRLPGFSGEWEDTTLGAIGECVIGLTYKPENVVEHGLLVLRSSNIQNSRLAFEDNVFVNVKVADHLVTRPGDLLVCVRNGSRALIGKSAVIDDSAAGLTFGAFMSVFRTKYWQFIAHAFQGHGIQRQIRDNIGATINQITNKDMRALRVRLPREAEQTAIAAVLSDMDADLAVLQARRDKTRDLKQAMMQELLTGKTRLVPVGAVCA